MSRKRLLEVSRAYDIRFENLTLNDNEIRYAPLVNRILQVMVKGDRLRKALQEEVVIAEAAVDRLDIRPGERVLIKNKIRRDQDRREELITENELQAVATLRTANFRQNKRTPPIDPTIDPDLDLLDPPLLRDEKTA